MFNGVKEAEEVWHDSKPTINKALKRLGDKNLAVIMHGNSFPSISTEDFTIGSPYSNGAKEFSDFFKGVFDKCVLGPWGATASYCKHSPYNSTLESLNPFFINFKFLTTDEGHRLLSNETFERIVNNKPKLSNRVDYSYVEQSVSDMLKEVYDNYLLRLNQKNATIVTLSKNIENFKKENNGIYLDAIYQALLKDNNGNDFKNWQPIDKELPILLEKNNKTAKKRVRTIYNKHKEFIDFYMFTQYLAKEHVKYSPIHYIADKQVALTSNDEWKLQDIILKEIDNNKIELGVPGDSFSSKGRCWGFPQIDIEKLFNKNGSLSAGGKKLFNIYRTVFRNNKGGVRIDHFQGIIDPYLCVNGSAERIDGAARFLSSPNHELFGRYSILTKKNIDTTKTENDFNRIKYLSEKQIDAYGRYFEKIILAAAKAEGLKEANIMPEDLGSITKPTVEVIKRNNLGSMKVTQFVDPLSPNHIYRGKNSLPNDFINTGTHDNKPLALYMMEMSQSKYENHLKMLTKDLNLTKPHIKNDRTYGIKLKFAELFVAPAKNVQVFFTHLLGMEDWYNKPGDKTVTKWSLRMPNNFKEIYFKNLINGTAFNPYDALARALKAINVVENKELINKLKYYERKLTKAFKA
jgi:4-alpha-glucanotransferase